MSTTLKLAAAVALGVVSLSACSGGEANHATSAQSTAPPSTEAVTTDTSTTSTVPNSTPAWIPISGTIVAASTAALVVASSQSGNAVLMSTSTQSSQTVTLSAPGAQCDNSNSTGCDDGNVVLTEPSSDHPSGEAIFTFQATIPASGLQPQSTSYYLQSIDVATGTTDATTTVTGVPGQTGGKLVYANNGAATMLVADQSGNEFAYNISLSSGATVAKTSLNASSSGSISTDGKYLLPITSISTDGNTCVITEYTAETLKPSSNITVPCRGEIARLDGSSTDIHITQPLCDGYIESTSDSQPTGKAFDLATGAAVPGTVVETGPRSTLALGWTDQSGSNTLLSSLYTFSIGSWTQGFTIPAGRTQALSLQVNGIADDDIWLTTSSQSIIIDGKTGATLQTSWTYVPNFGYNGWTVVSGSSSSGNSQQYLVEYSGRLVDALSSAPSSDTQAGQ